MILSPYTYSSESFRYGNEEARRVVPVIEAICRQRPDALVSVDTHAVARAGQRQHEIGNIEEGRCGQAERKHHDLLLKRLDIKDKNTNLYLIVLVLKK